jgi:hypothetical protein
VIVNVVNPSTFTVSANSNPICYGDTLTLIASGAATYTWLPSGVTGSTVNFVPPLGNNSFTIESANLNCVSQKTIQVRVVPIPTIIALANQTAVCSGQTVQLSASGAVSYNWLPSGSGAAITVTPNVSGVYSVTGTDNNNCSSSATVQVQVNPLPLLTVTAPTLICNGALVTFTAGGADSYAWNNIPGTATHSFIATANGTLSVTGTNTLTSCMASAATLYTVSACLSVDEIQSAFSDLTIYPNPSTGRIFFMNIVGSHFSIYDSKGLQVDVSSVDKNGGADISHLTPGLYFIVVKDQDKIYKVIKE